MDFKISSKLFKCVIKLSKNILSGYDTDIP